MQALEKDQRLRLECAGPVRVTCLFGVLWVTHPGEVRDLLLTRGESVRLTCTDGVVVSGFVPAVAGVQWEAKTGRCDRLVATVSRWIGMLGMRRADDLR